MSRPPTAPTADQSFHLYYQVESTSGRLWDRTAGPFATADAARDRLATLSGVVHYRIVEETVTTRVVDEQ